MANFGEKFRWILALLVTCLVLSACGLAPAPPDRPSLEEGEEEPIFCRPAFYWDEDGNLVDLCPPEIWL
jgi:hypothetical protein